MLRLSSPSLGEAGEGGGEEPCPLPGALLSPLTVSVSVRVIGVCSSLGVPVMCAWLSRLCELKTSKDLFVSFIFIYAV